MNRWSAMWAKQGEFFGYPKCCIDSFCRSNGVVTEAQKRVQKNGFVPCTKCAQKILKGEITIDSLITKRECKIEFK